MSARIVIVSKLLDQPFKALRLLLSGLFLALLILACTVGLRNLERVERIRRHTAETDRLQQLGLTLQGSLLSSRAPAVAPNGDPDPEADAAALARLERELADILSTHSHLDPETPRELAAIRTLLSRMDGRSAAGRREAVDRFREVLDAETSAANDLLARVEESTRFELVLAAFLVLAAVVAAAAGWVAFRRRIEVAAGALLGQQRALARAERLAAAGEMAASLAHELRNPLAGTQMAIANLMQDVTDPDHRQRLSLIGSELDRIARLVRNLLTQARQAPEPRRRLRLAPVVEELLALVRYQVPATIGLEAHIPPGLAAELPEDRFRQALLNLVLNAVEALDGGPGRVLVTAHRDNGELEMAVSDDGPGFPPELLENGIRPFHSTREEGTGLGLAIVRRLAADLGGRVDLGRREGGGALVRLRLPVPPTAPSGAASQAREDNP